VPRRRSVRKKNPKKSAPPAAFSAETQIGFACGAGQAAVLSDHYQKNPQEISDPWQ
jgi:hypothetical protein